MLGITPACAGNSSEAKQYMKKRGDHPRLRGEQNGLVCDFLPRKGSPPLARGTVFSDADGIHAGGITPACAGNRLKKDLLYLVFYNIVFHFSISFS